MTARARVDSVALATAANNALAFMPANSQVKVARVSITPQGVVFTATDTYAAGRDVCEVAEFGGTPTTLLVNREALQGLDSLGRKDRKGQGVLTATVGDGIVFTAQDQTLTPEAHMDMSPRVDAGEVLGMFEAIDEMLAEEQVFRTAFQPSLLMRFSKVKADKSERVADLAIDDPDAPVLVKIGTTFKGLIMPVTRDVHAANIGEEGLW